MRSSVDLSGFRRVEKGQLVTLPRFCVHHDHVLADPERPCAFHSARYSLALVPSSRKRVLYVIGLKNAFSAWCQKSETLLRTLQHQRYDERKQEIDERGPQLCDSPEKGSRAHAIMKRADTDATDARILVSTTERSIGCKTAQLSSQICSYGANWGHGSMGRKEFASDKFPRSSMFTSHKKAGECIGQLP